MNKWIWINGYDYELIAMNLDEMQIERFFASWGSSGGGGGSWCVSIQSGNGGLGGGGSGGCSQYGNPGIVGSGGGLALNTGDVGQALGINANGGNAGANTGGGGGGSSYKDGNGGNGGSGIVIVQFTLNSTSYLGGGDNSYNPSFTWYNDKGSGMNRPYNNTIGLGVNSNNILLLSSNNINIYGNFAGNGNITATGYISSSSDIKLKRDINSLTSNVLDLIDRINPVNFIWNNNIDIALDNRDKNDVGFIAQELETVIPLAVNEYVSYETNNRYKNIKYDKLLPYLIKGIQELNSNIIEYRKEIKKIMSTLQ